MRPLSASGAIDRVTRHEATVPLKNHSGMQSAKYIPAIDGMRAIAILIVVTSHLVKDGIIPGGLGVTLFFFISGYLITGLLIDECEASGAIDIKYFYVRRFMRLAPALLTMVAVVSLTYLLVFGVTSIKEILAAVFYFMNYYQIMHGAMPIPLGPLWSLAIEEHFYLVFPLVIALTWRFRERLFVSLIVVCVLVLVWRTILVAGGAEDFRTYIGTDTRIDSIVYGALLAIANSAKAGIGLAYPPPCSNRWCCVVTCECRDPKPGIPGNRALFDSGDRLHSAFLLCSLRR